MRVKLVLFAAAGLLTMQGCQKKEMAETKPDVSLASTKKNNIITGSYGSYTITNVTSGFAMEVSGFTTYGQKQDNARGVQQWTASTTAPERWQKWNAIDLGNGYYKLMNLYSGKVLEVFGNSTTQGAQVSQYEWNAGNNQQWQLTVVGFGAYKIINRQTGLALTNEGNSTANGAIITQRTFVNNGSQWWVFNPFALDSYRDDDATRFFKRTSGSTAFDGVTSTPLTYGNNNGKVFWTTNDTWYQGQGSNIGSDGLEACHGTNSPIAYSRTALLQPGQYLGLWNWSPSATNNILTNQGLKIVPNYKPEAGEWIWPSGVVEVGSHIYMYADEGNYGDASLSPNTVGLYDINQSNSGSNVNYTASRVSNTELDSWNFTSNLHAATRWMCGMVKHSDGGVNYVYMFGYKTSNSNGVCVARFPASTPGSWTFWTGSGWSTSVGAVQPIFNAGGGGFFVSKVNNKFVLVTMDFGFGCDAGTTISTSFSTSPTSGFSTLKNVYSLPDYKENHRPIHYALAIHPQFETGYGGGAAASKELLVTYCVNFYGSCVTMCNTNGKLDPNDYRAKGFRIPWALIGI